MSKDFKLKIQDDNWFEFETEDSKEKIDVNMFFDDYENIQRMAFYPTYTNEKGYRETDISCGDGYVLIERDKYDFFKTLEMQISELRKEHIKENQLNKSEVK
tara:strand:- start:466 stop:771 length:306 start_codon:yes stop_codon:yes gene_type:complete